MISVGLALSVLNGTRCGRPFSSKPVIQVTLVNGLPIRNWPVVRSSTYHRPLRLAHIMTLRGLHCQSILASTGTCVESSIERKSWA